jgi:hypothetical protein
VFETHGFDGTNASGVAALGERWREWMRAWEEYRVEADESREIDAGRVLVLMRHGGRGKASGVKIDHFIKPGANVFDIRDGKLVKLALYWERDHALADLGLEE